VLAAVSFAAIGLTLQAAPATGATVAAATTSNAGVPGPVLTLVSQTSWVTPAHPTFDVELALGPGAPAVSQLGLTIALYPCLGTPTGFDQTVTSKNGPSGRPLTETTSPVGWTSLAPALGGGVDVPIPVVTDGSSSPVAGAPGGFAARLRDCNVANGGVYPVRVQLVDTRSNAVVGALTTHLVYSTAPTDTKKLHFAWELPIQTPIGPAPTPPSALALAADPLSALAKPSPTALNSLTQVVGAVAAAPTVPVTVAVSGQTLHALSADGHASTVATLKSPNNQTPRQFLWTSYVPVDAASLVGAGLTGELTLQLHTGWVGVATVSKAPAPSVAGTAGPWITNDAIDDPTLAQLQAQGYDQVVLPPSDVTSSPTPSSGGSTAAPFTIASAHGSSFTALVSDSDLSSRFTGDPGDPVLAAHQFLADLAQIYFEGGNTQSVRGVVAVPPNNWSANPIFVKTLLGELSAQNPVVQAVTVSGLFQALAAPVSCRAQGCKLAAVPRSSGVGLPVTAISTQRSRLDSFAAAAPSAHSAIGQIGNLLLSGQSETLRSAQQATVVNRTGSALGAQLGQLSVAGDTSFTLTARNGSIPVTIASNAGYPVKGTLTLTSDKLTFADGTSRYSEAVPLAKSTNNFYVPVQARASGEFKVGITLTSPSGGLILTRGAVTVRSTATSVVGIILSLGAIAVLLAWWVRTTVRRRAQRRSEQADGIVAR
jgi:hypothetical protein